MNRVVKGVWKLRWRICYCMFALSVFTTTHFLTKFTKPIYSFHYSIVLYLYSDLYLLINYWFLLPWSWYLLYHCQKRISFYDMKLSICHEMSRENALRKYGPWKKGSNILFFYNYVSFFKHQFNIFGVFFRMVWLF